MGDLAHALGWRSIPVPRPLVGAAALGAGLPLVPSIAQWVNAGRVPVVMDTKRARQELRWRPKYDTRETLSELVAGARELGVV
jgi:nucleoside-diphosphate-sugar epimerase